MNSTPLIIFAQTPPPEHGQSQMVALMLEELRKHPEFDVTHINARFSQTIDEIGENSLSKLRLSLKFLWKGIKARFKKNKPILYYIPGPVKWSAIIRDWLLLTFLRITFPKVVFHWHAVGQGEWAHGSERISLPGPKWLDRVGRKISAWVLREPELSISVSPTSTRDAYAVSSKRQAIVVNGLEDPCVESELFTRRRARLHEIANNNATLRMLFLSHGTIAKGLIDCLEALSELFSKSDFHKKGVLTIAGGVHSELQPTYEKHLEKLKEIAGDRLEIHEKGFVVGQEKFDCYADHDVFIAPSHWESFGLTVTEAMAHGMIVVACASDGVKGVLPPNYPLLAPVKSPSILSDRLEDCYRIAGDEAAGWQLATELRKRFSEKFLLSKFRTGITNVFHEIADLNTNFSPLPLKASARVVDLNIYLADQNPKLGRSLGISRMTEVVLQNMAHRDDLKMTLITSKSSLHCDLEGASERILPWSTRPNLLRLITDQLHPAMFHNHDHQIQYYPKGFLPFTSHWCRPSVVTIHDTIIQFYSDHYPQWRHPLEYRYWAALLKNTLRNADAVLTVSKSSRQQIIEFMKRFKIPAREIIVTYEPCYYEFVPQPDEVEKENYAVHFASREPHKRTAMLITRWAENESRTHGLELHLIGKVPDEVAEIAANCDRIVQRPFLEEPELQHVISKAKALIFPSEIEGFGLPAIEAYYLGTPVVFRKGTSVEEVLAITTSKGGFTAKQPLSMFDALDETLTMSPEEIRTCGLRLREEYAASKVADRMVTAFKAVAEAPLT